MKRFGRVFSVPVGHAILKWLVMLFLPFIWSLSAEEATLERVDFTLQLVIFVTSEKEGKMSTIFFLSIFCQLLSQRF